MTAGKNFPVFLICCILVTVPLFLPVPAAALDSGTTVISGTIPLVVYDITVTGINWYDATVSWRTNDDADSTVEYGTTTGYGSVSSSGSLVKNHMTALHSLSPGTVYHFRVISVNLAGNHAVSADSVFATPPLSPVTIVPVTTNEVDSWDWGSALGVPFVARLVPAPEATTRVRQEPQQTGAAPNMTTTPAFAPEESAVATGPAEMQTSPAGPVQTGLIPGNFFIIMGIAVLIVIGIMVLSIWHYRRQLPEKRE